MAPSSNGLGENQEQAFELMDRAWDGGQFLRHRRCIWRRPEQTFIGRWLEAKGSRSAESIASELEVFNPVAPGQDRLCRPHICGRIDASLGRLRTDRWTCI